MANLPPPATTEQMYLAEILSELQALNELLTASIMPAMAGGGGGGDGDPELVQLREPKRRAPKRGSLPRRPPTDEFDQELDG